MGLYNCIGGCGCHHHEERVKNALRRKMGDYFSGGLMEQGLYVSSDLARRKITSKNTPDKPAVTGLGLKLTHSFCGASASWWTFSCGQ